MAVGRRTIAGADDTGVWKIGGTVAAECPYNATA
jgi:hypothetical protein